MKTLPKTLFIQIPFLGRSKENIKEQRLRAKEMFPDAKKYTYVKPELIKDSDYGDFWTMPMIQVKTM